MTTIDPAWVPVYHRVNNDGSAGCGGLALYAVRRYRPQDDLSLENFRLLDGSLPPAHGHALCGTCGSDVLARDGWDFFGDIIAQVMDRG
jgi:hypothetical protein